MSTVRIWDLNPHFDANAVKRTAYQVVRDSQLDNLFIQTVDKKAFLIRKGKALSNTLRQAIQLYLQQDDYVIFVADSHSPPQTDQQPRVSDSLISHVAQVVKDNIFDGRVFLARSVQELNAWLPITQKSFEGNSTAWQKEWNNIVTSFHDAFANTPENEVARDLDATLEEVRRERT